MEKRSNKRSWINSDSAPGSFRFLPLSREATGQTEAIPITQWTFDESFRGPNNSPAPDFGPGTAIAIGTEDPLGNPILPNADVIGSLRDRSDSSTPHNAWRIRSTGPCNGFSLRNRTTGVQFNVPTTGYYGISLRFDWLATKNAPAHAQVQYTINGRDYRPLGPPFPAAGKDIWDTYSFDLSGIPEVNDNPFFGFRIVAAYNPNPFKSITQNDQGDLVEINHGPHEAFISTRDLEKETVTEPWTPHQGNFRFDTIIIQAARPSPPSTEAKD
jgi:hypothetical protein